MEIITEIDFDFKFAFDNYKKMVSDFTKENLDGVAEQLKDNIKNFKGTPISDTTRSVRLIRGRTGTKPLIDTGSLLNSIKKTKKGISIKAYGLHQDEGYTIKTKHAFFAPNKKAARKKLYQVGGKMVPSRPWIHYTPKAKDYNLFFKKLMKNLRTTKRVISTKRITL